MNVLFARALAAFLALPGVVAFLVPLLWLAPGGPAVFVNGLGLIPVVLGTVLLLWCAREFYVAGRGTLAPWAPPQALVSSGFYRFSRNPMYVAVSLILWGWTFLFASRSLALYTVAVMLLFHVRVVMFEEPWLARTHPDAWEYYRTRVPRWLGIHRWLGGTM